MPLDHLYQQPLKASLAMPGRPPMAGHTRRYCEQRTLVFDMRPYSTKTQAEKSPSQNQNTGRQAWREMSLDHLSQRKLEASVAMQGRSSVGNHTGDYPQRLMVSRLQRQSQKDH
jgi:hypothetical protein